MVISVIHNVGQTIVRYRRAAEVRSATLVVTFTGFEGGRSDAPGFAEEVLAKSGYDCIAFKMSGRNNYSDISWEEARQLVGPIAAGYRTVVTYGGSGGAYAALYFADAVGASLVISLSPRNTKDPDYLRLRPGETRPAFRHAKLAALPPRRALAVVVYDPYLVKDRIYYEREIRPLPGCIAIRFPFGHHPLSRLLAEIGLLKPMLLDALAVCDDPSAAVAAIKARLQEAWRLRRTSTIYLSHVAAKLGRRKRHAAFDRVVAEIDPARLSHKSAVMLGIAYRYAERDADFRSLVEEIAAIHPRPAVIRGAADRVAASRKQPVRQSRLGKRRAGLRRALRTLVDA
jgi:hypothetical protein